MLAADTSLLAWAVNRGAPEHARAAAVLETLANGDRPWAVPWSVAHEFLTLVTHPHAVVRALRPADAWGFLDELAASPSVHWLAATSRHAEVVSEVLALARVEGPGLPAGFETAVLLREHGVRELLTADRTMRRWGFLDVRDPLHGEPWTPAAPPRRRYRVLGPRGVR